jgi:hypothetical protein
LPQRLLAGAAAKGTQRPLRWTEPTQFVAEKRQTPLVCAEQACEGHWHLLDEEQLARQRLLLSLLPTFVQR